ncbi:MAG: hypothetical protein ABI824_12810 [Acidobacteriota bacterium]
MSFYSRYELASIVTPQAPAGAKGAGSADDIKSFHAFVRETRRPVLLHLIGASNLSLVQRLEAVRNSSDVVDMGEFAGSVYLVTEVLQPFPGIPAWLDARGGADLEQPTRSVSTPTNSGLRLGVQSEQSYLGSAAPEPVAETVSEPSSLTLSQILPPLPPEFVPATGAAEKSEVTSDEFTALFGVRPTGPIQVQNAGTRSFPPPLEPLPPAREPDPGPRVIPPPNPEPGKFTQILQAAEASAYPVASSHTSDPGEFTRMMAIGGLEASPAGLGLTASPASQSDPGDFTRIMGVGQASRTPGPAPAASSSASPLEQDVWDTPARPAASGYVSGLFANPFPAAAVPEPQSMPHASETPPAPEPPVTSDSFTRQFFSKPAAGKNTPESSNDFDKFFGPGLKGGAMDIEEEAAKQQGTPVSDARPFVQAGDFTRVFGALQSGEAGGSAARPAAGSRAPLHSDGNSSLSGIFKLEPEAQTPPTVSAEGGAAQLDHATKTIGEYTRVISVPQPRDATSSEPAAVFGAAVESPEDAKNRHQRWLMIGGGVLLAVLLIAVVYLLMERGAK